MGKAYKAEITAAEAARTLITFANQAYVWANENAIMAQSLWGRKMVLVNLAHAEEYVLIVDESIYNSEYFLAEFFPGLEKCRFSTTVKGKWSKNVFNTTEANLIGDIHPARFEDDSYIKPDYTGLCKILGVVPVNLEAEKADEYKALRPLVDDGTLIFMEAEAIAWSVINRIDFAELQDWERRKARIKAVVDYMSSTILNEFERRIEKKLPDSNSSATLDELKLQQPDNPSW